MGYKNVNKWKIILYLGCKPDFLAWFFDSFIYNFLSICPKLLSRMSPSSFEIRLFLSSAAHKALDGFLYSQYLSSELFRIFLFIFFISSCNFFVSMQGDEAYVLWDLITLREGTASSSSPSPKSEEERTSTPQETDGRFRVGFCCASGGS